MFVHRCKGCGRLATDANKDLIMLRDMGHISCCPERSMEVVPVNGPTADQVTVVIRDALLAMSDHPDVHPSQAPYIDMSGDDEIIVDGRINLPILVQVILENYVTPIGDNKHWQKMADWRLQAANSYLATARLANARRADSAMRLKALTDVLELCRRTFTEYAQMHIAKGPGHEAKVERNQRLAGQCAAVLDPIEPSDKVQFPSFNANGPL